MARTSFFATRSDIEPGLRAIEAQRRLRYIQCTPGLQIPDAHPVLFESLLEAESLSLPRSDNGFYNFEYLVVTPESRFAVETRAIGGHDRYFVRIEPDQVVLFLTPGGLYDNCFLLAGEVALTNLSGEEAVDLYRLFS